MIVTMGCGVVLLACRRGRPGALLHILHAQDSPQKKNDPAPPVSSAAVGDPALLTVFQAHQSVELGSVPVSRGYETTGMNSSASHSLKIFYHCSQIPGILSFVSIALGLLKGASFGRPELLYRCLRT